MCGNRIFLFEGERFAHEHHLQIEARSGRDENPQQGDKHQRLLRCDQYHGDRPDIQYKHRKCDMRSHQRKFDGLFDLLAHVELAASGQGQDEGEERSDHGDHRKGYAVEDRDGAAGLL